MVYEKVLGVGDVGVAMQRFGWVDYITFIAMLGICLLVGAYFAIWKKSETAQDYLVASRSMGVVPIAMSLLASWVSGISLLGIPTEVYVYGIQYLYIIGGFFITTFLMGSIFLPVFQELQLTSTYEYHERRFNKKVRLFGSILFTIKMLSWLPLVIYVPALAFNQVLPEYSNTYSTITLGFGSKNFVLPSRIPYHHLNESDPESVGKVREKQEGIITAKAENDRTVLGVGDVGVAMQRFGWVDYITFIAMLGICLLVGAYFAIWKKSETAQDYLVASRSMGVVPIAMSLLASWVSGISLLGIPTEVYVYGIQYLYIIGGFFITTFLMGSIFLPVFQELELTSTYEYHERRFNKKVRLFGSILFTIKMLSWLPLVIYVPALAFNQVTGVNVHLITPIVCIFCILYTSLGGLKGVVWTDVIQLILMFGALILVTIKGTLDVGGIRNVIQRNLDSNRLEGPNFDLDPLSRHTIWALVIGGTFFTVQTAGVNQNMIQRYLSLPSLKHSKRALWTFFFGISILLGFCGYCGMLIYATFYKCDPLTTTLAREKDQLLPLLVMEILGDYPGLSGIFVAGIFSAALSSLSTALNAMAAIVLEDFYKPFFNKKLTEKQTFILMKSTVIITGIICIALVFVVEKLGAVLQLSMSIGSIANGPSLGVSAMGILLPWVNGKGALSGGLISLIFMSWYCFKTQSMIASGDLTFPEKPVSTDGCHYQFTPKIPLVNNVTHTDEQFMIYRLSYLWYCLIGTFVAMFVGLLVSMLTKPMDPRDVDPRLLAPFVRRLIKPRKYSNQPRDGIIYAYDIGNAKNVDNKEWKKADVKV